MNVTLYGFPRSCSLVSMIALEEAGWNYDIVVPDLFAGEHLEAAYLAINPKGRVPSLSVDGVILTETPAILQFIADRSLQANLIPPVSYTMKRAQVISRVSWLASSTLTACNRVAVPSNVCTGAAAEQTVRVSALSAIERDLLLIENELAFDGWWMDTFSIADIFAFFIHDAAQQFGVDVSQMPRLSELTARIGSRPAVARAMEWTRTASISFEPAAAA